MFNVNLHANRYLDDVRPSISANPGVESDPGNPYYTLHYGDLAIFLSDAQCRQLLDVLASRPDLPKTDHEPECTCVLVGDMADATGCEVHRKGRNASVAEPLRTICNNISGGDDAEF